MRDEKLFISHGWRELQNLGTYHVVNVYRNEAVNSHINPDDLEAELSECTERNSSEVIAAL